MRAVGNSRKNSGLSSRFLSIYLIYTSLIVYSLIGFAKSCDALIVEHHKQYSKVRSDGTIIVEEELWVRYDEQIKDNGLALKRSIFTYNSNLDKSAKIKGLKLYLDGRERKTKLVQQGLFTVLNFNSEEKLWGTHKYRIVYELSNLLSKDAEDKSRGRYVNAVFFDYDTKQFSMAREFPIIKERDFELANNGFFEGEVFSNVGNLAKHFVQVNSLIIGEAQDRYHNKSALYHHVFTKPILKGTSVSFVSDLPEGILVHDKVWFEEHYDVLGGWTISLLAIMQCFLTLAFYNSNRKKHKPVAHAYLPKYFTPAISSFFTQGFKMNSKILATALSDLVSREVISLETRGNTFVLKRLRVTKEIPRSERKFVEALFVDGDEFVVNSSNKDRLAIAVSAFKRGFLFEFESFYFFANRHWRIGALVTFLLTSLLFIMPEQEIRLTSFMPLGMLLLYFAFYIAQREAVFNCQCFADKVHGFRSYFSDNLAVKEDIDYNLYKKYLPYALSVNAEPSWTARVINPKGTNFNQKTFDAVALSLEETLGQLGVLEMGEGLLA